MRSIRGIALAAVCVGALAVPAGGQTIRGKIIDSVTRSPLSRISVTLIDSLSIPVGRVTLTDSLGLYTLRPPRTGSWSVQARRLGYAAKMVDVDVTSLDTTVVNIALRAIPQQLDSVVRREGSTSIQAYQQQQFVRRQLAGFGRVIDRAKIVREQYVTVKDVLQSIPELRVSRFGNVASINWEHRCGKWAIYRNGALVTPAPDEIANLLTQNADGIYGVEVFPGPTFPTEYRAGVSDDITAAPGKPVPNCGVIAYWTRPP